MSVTHERTSDGIPIEQAICRKKLRPGSGFLSISITTDGPTRVLQIADSKNKVYILKWLDYSIGGIFFTQYFC